jgi:hypothetical protein
MGWKARVREIADRDPDAVPPELHADSSSPDSRRWPIIQKNAIRNAGIGITLIGAVFGAMHGLALEPSHARERRWPADCEINVNSRRPVMRVVLLMASCLAAAG